MVDNQPNDDSSKDIPSEEVEGQLSEGDNAVKEGDNQPISNPESSNVALNHKTEERVISKEKPKTVIPKKIGKEKVKKSKATFLVGCGGIFIFLFIMFIVLMTIMMARATGQNPVMQAFGLDPASIKQFLLLVVSLSFGFLSLLFVILIVVGIFKLGTAKKADQLRRVSGLKMVGFSLLPLILVVFLWFYLYNFIGNIKIQADQVIAEIVVVEPAEIDDLVAPIEITYSALNVAKALEFGGIGIEEMKWDLDGDDEYEMLVTDAEVTRLYMRKGDYKIGLRVKLVGEEEYRYYIKNIPIPNALFEAEPAEGNIPLKVSFDAGDLFPPGFKIQSLDWDFDDDGKYELEGPDNTEATYTFEKIGEYNVHLRIVDQNNNVQNYYRVITVKESSDAPVKAYIKAVPGTTGTIPLKIRFDGSDSESLKGNIINYEWDLGDGSDLQTGKSISYIYNESGEYKATLTVEDSSGDKATTSLEIKTNDLSAFPEALMTTTPVFDEDTMTLEGMSPFKVNFDASKSTDTDGDIVDYKWDINGDGEADYEGKKGFHLYEEAGNYSIKLTITDSDDQIHSTSVKVVVANPGVQALINADPEEGVAPLTVHFDGSASTTSDGNIVSYEWDFGDETSPTITSATVSHKYENVGTYTVTLKVLTNEDESGETTHTVYVREVPLTSCFTPSRRSGIVPLTVSFDTKCSTGAVTSYSWDFGDGEVSDSRKPSHTFEFPGEYTITLEVIDDKNNVNKKTDTIVVEEEITQ